MKLDEKLDLIIELLKEINQKLGGNFPIPKPDKVKVIRVREPTEEQLRNQSVVEWATKSDRRSFLKVWKRDLPKILEIQRRKPDFYPEFEPQTLRWFSKFKNPKAAFYKKLKLEILTYCKGVTLEMRNIIDKYRKEHPELL